MTMTLDNSPVAGWYPDPGSPSGQRYWDGRAWTVHTSDVLAPPRGVPLGQTQTFALYRNPLAGWALGIGIVSLFINLFTIVPIVGLILGIVALGRAGRIGQITGHAVGRAAAIWAIVLSSLGIVAFFAIALPIILGSGGTTFDRAATEQTIIDQAQQNGTTFTSVECPTSPSIREGNEFQCIATLEDNSTIMVNVRIQDNDGSYTWDTNPFK